MVKYEYVEDELELLHPPRAPKILTINKKTSDGVFNADAEEWLKGVDQIVDETSTIDFDAMPKEYWEYCASNDAQRAWRRAVFFKTNRTTTAEMKREVKDKINIIKFIDKNKLAYTDVMKEYKEKVKKIRGGE